MAYKELVKNFEKIRSYMREFYVYGFKSRNEFDSKSLRSYDDEKRRIESWLGSYMNFTVTPEGKKVFLSFDNRVLGRNPLYKAWKSKSFTDGDITLHFILFDILYEASIKKPLKEIIDTIENKYLCCFKNPPTFDESTIRKKLKEYTEIGIIETEKQGKQVLYKRSTYTDVSAFADVLPFYSEVAPLGVIGSYTLDKLPEQHEVFSFKHHYVTGTLDGEILETLFVAIRKKCCITADNLGKLKNINKTVKLVPLKIYISTQNGKQNLIAYNIVGNSINSYRLDYLSNVKLCEVYDKFDLLRQEEEKREKYVWGVNFKWNIRKVEYVSFVIKIGYREEYILNRLNREKRIGKVEKIDDTHYRFSAEVFDTTEIIPWIRTFISRITELKFSNRTVENKFKRDLEAMYMLYEIEGGEQ